MQKLQTFLTCKRAAPETVKCKCFDYDEMDKNKGCTVPFNV